MLASAPFVRWSISFAAGARESKGLLVRSSRSGLQAVKVIIAPPSYQSAGNGIALEPTNGK